MRNGTPLALGHPATHSWGVTTAVSSDGRAGAPLLRVYSSCRGQCPQEAERVLSQRAGLA